MKRKYQKKNRAKLELCLSIDKEHPGLYWSKRYYVDEVEQATRNHRPRRGWLETIPSIGFQFQAKDFLWVRANETNNIPFSQSKSKD